MVKKKFMKTSKKAITKGFTKARGRAPSAEEIAYYKSLHKKTNKKWKEKPKIIIAKKRKEKKSLSNQMSFLEYEIMSNINFLRKKKHKVNMQLIYNQLDDDPKRQISGFTRGMLSKKWLKLTKREGIQLTDEGKRYYNSFKRKWDS